MILNKIYKFLGKIELKSYEYFKSNKFIPIYFYPFFLIKGLFNLTESILRNLSGPFGLLARRFYYSLVFDKIGNDVLIDVGVVLKILDFMALVPMSIDAIFIKYHHYI